MNEGKFEKVLGWVGSVAGIIGSLMLAMNFEYSGYAYIFYIISSITLSYWAYRTGAKHNLMMNMCFLCMNILGVYNWLIAA